MKKIILIGIALLLTACAPQKYQTRYAYTPPAERSGTVCIQRCSAQQNQCKKRFTVITQQCLQRARQQAKLEMPGRLAAYEQALTVWEARARHYERDLRLYRLKRRSYSILHEVARDCRRGSKRHGYEHDCRRRHLPRWRGSVWLDEPVYPGGAPRRPTLETVTRTIATKTCGQENQCVVNYNQCYSSCGGTVKPYQVLLKNK